MIEHGTLFAVSSVLLVGMAAVFLLWTLRFPAGARPHGYAVVVACGSMGVAYGLMSAELLTVTTTGRTESVARFLGYTVSWSAVCFVLGAIVDADRGTLLALVGSVLIVPWATFASWILGGTAGTVASLAIFAALSGVAYVLVGPLSRIADNVGGQRALLYRKVKNLILLVFIGLVVTGTISEQNLELTGAFVGQTVATYIDLIWLAGFGMLVLRYGDALADESVPSPLSLVTGDGRPPVGDVEPAD